MITTLSLVKTLARLYDLSGEGLPDNSLGSIGDVYMDKLNGLTYEKTGETTWTPDTSSDLLIELSIQRAERDYLAIRGKAFDIDEDENAIYPDGADFTAAEMVCYILDLGDYEGRGKQSESVAGRNVAMEAKLHGYPWAIAGGIERYSNGAW